MRNPVVRVLMVVVGLATFLAYAAVASLGYLLVEALFALRATPVVAAVGVLLAAVAVGYASYRVGTRQLLARLDASRLPRERAPEVYDRIERLCDRLDVAVPTVYVARMERPNALAVGGARRGAIVLDRTLFRVLDADAFDALVAHELAHLSSYDGLVVTVADATMRTVAGLVVVAAFPVLVLLRGASRALAWASGRPHRPRTTVFDLGRALVERVVVGLMAALSLPLFALSRRREFAADRRAAEVTDPIAMARALRRIERAAAPDWGLLSLLYTRGDEREGSRLFSTHPDTDERVRRLVEMAEARGRVVDRPVRVRAR